MTINFDKNQAKSYTKFLFTDFRAVWILQVPHVPQKDQWLIRNLKILQNYNHIKVLFKIHVFHLKGTSQQLIQRFG